MAASHICLTCGIDLVRTRAVIEPLYGLPLVSCPRCGTHAVRRRDPIVTRWRRGLRAVIVIIGILLRCVAVFLLLMGTVSLVFSIESGLRYAGMGWLDLPVQMLKPASERLSRFDQWYETDGLVSLAGWVAVAVSTGTFLTVAMPHWKRWRLWAAWTAALVAVTTWASWSPTWQLMLEHSGISETGSTRSGLAAARRERDAWPARSAAMAATAAVAAGGIPIGRLIGAAWGARVRGMRARRRRRLRHQRMGQ